MRKPYNTGLAILNLRKNIWDVFSTQAGTFSNFYHLIWVKSGKLNLSIDGVCIPIDSHQIVFINPFESVHLIESYGELVVLQFNGEFYKEVKWVVKSCNTTDIYPSLRGGSVINLNEKEIQDFENLLTIFIDEFKNKDVFQEQILKITLNKFMLKALRCYVKQHTNIAPHPPERDLFQQFYLLLEKHYKQYHKVTDYAELLNKSPKTLTNQFKLLGCKRPSYYIQQRLIRESKRYLIHSQLSIKEIAFELGFERAASYSNYFKSKTGLSPKNFKRAYTEYKNKEG